MPLEYMATPSTSLDLETRSGLPEALRELLEQYPRNLWEGHSNFDGLIRFWLERHVMFRRLIETLQSDINQLQNIELAPEQYKNRTARFGNMFVNELHMHHNIEDHQYFPVLEKMEPRLARGFEILDADHHAIDKHLEGFTGQANKLFESSENLIMDNASLLQENLENLECFLNRHLNDEEELVVPIVLKYGFEH